MCDRDDEDARFLAIDLNRERNDNCGSILDAFQLASTAFTLPKIGIADNGTARDPRSDQGLLPRRYASRSAINSGGESSAKKACRSYILSRSYSSTEIS